MSGRRTIVVTGSASGIGAATCARLAAEGATVIGVDRRDADIVADLSTPGGRATAIAGVGERVGGQLAGLVACAGVAGVTDRPGGLVAAVNYFGTVAVVDGLRPLLAAAGTAAAVVIGSNSATCQPGVPQAVVERCLAGDEAGARTAADDASALATYPATKLAVTRWARRQAPTAAWAGAGITLNVVAPGKVETALLEETRLDTAIGHFVDAFPVPVGRSAEPAEIASAVAFLLGPDARFICGSVLFVDGGTDAQYRADDLPAPMSWAPAGP